VTAARRALAALRDFVRGFLGLVSPAPTDRAGARAELGQRATRRDRCC
jgi:hypothetical protein